MDTLRTMLSFELPIASREIRIPTFTNASLEPLPRAGSKCRLRTMKSDGARAPTSAALTAQRWRAGRPPSPILLIRLPFGLPVYVTA